MLFSFPNLRFKRSGADITAAATAVTVVLASKVEMRKKLIHDLCKDIQVEDIISEMDEYGSTRSSSTHISVKDREVIRAEVGLIKQEEERLDQLTRITRNLDPKREFDLSFDELKSLGL